MVNITIDNQKLQVTEGITVLQAARRFGISIPTLCYHEAMEPYGSCRLCIVELNYDKRSRLMTACTYPVWEGLEVKTNTEEVINARRFIIELLLARCPNSTEIQRMARQLQVEKMGFKTRDENEKCILCGLCIRVCQEIIGSSAISFINRGIDRVVETPFETESGDCIGCGACAFVCPTGIIKIEDINEKRKLENWHTELKLVKCKGCEEYFTTEAVLKCINKKKIELPKDLFEYCGKCRAKSLRKQLRMIKEGELSRV